MCVHIPLYMYLLMTTVHINTCTHNLEANLEKFCMLEKLSPFLSLFLTCFLSLSLLPSFLVLLPSVFAFSCILCFQPSRAKWWHSSNHILILATKSSYQNRKRYMYTVSMLNNLFVQICYTWYTFCVSFSVFTSLTITYMCMCVLLNVLGDWF